VANHHVIIRSGQLTIELQAQDGPFMARELDAWTQAILDKTGSGALPPLQSVAMPALNPTIPESVIIPLPQPAVDAAQTAGDEPTDTLAALPAALPPQPVVEPDRVMSPAHQPDQDTMPEQPVAETLLMPREASVSETVTEPALLQAETLVDEAATSTQPVLPPELEAFYGNQPEATPQPVAVTDEPETVGKDDFSLVLNQVMADFEDDADNPTDPQTDEEPAQPTGLIESLADLCDVVHPDNAEELLLAAGYYLTFFEGKDSFSLKQLNSQLLLANESSISHSVLAKAIESDCLTLVPDATGAADTPEYALTPASRQQVETWMKGQR
jgi:hypothetical protein